MKKKRRSNAVRLEEIYMRTGRTLSELSGMGEAELALKAAGFQLAIANRIADIDAGLNER